jgi:fibronectin-binding autotransporter adhesin
MQMPTKTQRTGKWNFDHKAIRTLRARRTLALAAAAGSAAMSLSSGLAHAASQTWTNTGASANWSDSSNWGGNPAPGSTSSTTNTDVATFNLPVGTFGTSGNPVVIDQTTQNIGGISFDTAAGPYTIGSTSGNSLLLTSGGTVQILSSFSGTGATQTINAPLTIEPTSPTTIGTYTFANGSADPTNVLNFGGNITGGTTNFVNTSDSAPDGGSIVLALGGSNTGLNTISGLISDGGAQAGAGNGTQQGLAIQKTGAGTWYLTNNNNTYSGATEISQGILNVSSLSNYGSPSAIGDRGPNQDANTNGGGIGILINGGTLQYTGSTPQSTTRQIRLGVAKGGVNSIDASGSNPSATLSFTHSGANANLFQGSTNVNLTLTGNNTGNNNFGISLTNGVSLVKSGVGTWMLSGASTNNGTTAISAGTLRLNTPGSIGSASYTTAGSYTFSPAANDLITGFSPTANTNAAAHEGSGAVTLLTNGSIGAGPGSTDNSARYTINNNESITYSLGNSPAGYNLSTVNLYSVWNDSGRSRIDITSISYSTVANPSTFITIPNSNLSFAGGGGANFAGLAAAGGLLATGAADIQFNFAGQENGYVGYGELEAVGTATTTGLSASTPVQIASGATFDLNGNVQTIVSLSDSGGGGGIVANSASVPAALNINPSGGSTTFSGTITDSGSGNAITVGKSGAGTQTLAGANSYSGATALNGGTLNITGTNTGGGPLALNSGGGTININSSGTVAISTITWNAANGGIVNLVGGTLLESGNANDNGGSTGNALNFAGGTLESAAPITINGALPINFTGTATIDTTGGNITINPGLAFNGSSGNGTFTVQGGHTLTASLNLKNPWTGNTVITGNGTVFRDLFSNGLGLNGGNATAGDFAVGAGATLVDLQNGNSTTYAGTISGPGGFTLTGPGTLKLTGTLTAPSTIAGGGSLDMGGVSQNFPSISNLNGVGGSVINTVAATPVTLTLSPTGSTTTFSGSIGGDTSTNAISLVLNGAGTQVLAGANTYHGSTSVLAGTLKLAPSPAVHLSLNGTLSDSSLNGDNGTFNGNGSATFAAGIHGQAIVLSSASQQYISVGPTTPNLDISGSYTVSLWENPSGSQQPNATLISTRNGGELTYDLQVSPTGVHSDIGTGNAWITTSANATATIAGGWNMVTEVVTPSGYTIYVNGNNIGGGTFSALPTFMKAGEFLAIGANEQGQGIPGLTNTFFNGAIEEVNVFDTALTQSQVTGLFSFTTPTTLPLNTPLTVASGATIDLGGTSETVSTLSDSAGAGGSVINSAATTPVTLTIAPTSGATTFSGVIGGDTVSNPISLVMNGNGTQILAGLNTYLGSTTISAGTLQAGSTQAFGNNSAVALANVTGANLALNGFSNQIGSLSGGGTTGGNVSLGSATLTDVQTTATTFGGVISGTGGAVTLNGNGGALTLTGSSTYSGPTTISAGTLTVSGTGSINNSSSITVNGSGAAFVKSSSVASTPAVSVIQGTLNGTGTVGNVTVSSLPGNTVTNQVGGGSGVLTINNTLAFNGNGTLGIFVPGGATTAAGIATTTFTTANTHTGEVLVNVTPTSAWALGTTTYNLVSFSGVTGNLSDFTKGAIADLTSRESASLGLTANDLTLTITADAPKWTGKDSTSWLIGSTGSNHNWQLITAGTPTDYIDGDSVVFDDSATAGNGTITPGAVNISSGDVSPTTTLFSNSVINYTLTSTNGVIAGNGTLTKNGTASLTINTANTYAGGTIVNGGNMIIGAGGTLGATTGSLAVNNPNTGPGTAVLLNLPTASPTTTGSLSGTIATPSSGTNTATIDNGGQLFTVNQTTPGTFGGTISDTGGFTLGSLSTSSLTLSGQNTYTGPTTVSAGTLAAGVSSVPGVSGAFGNNSAVTIANVSGATLAVNSGINAQIGSLSGGGTTGGSVTLASGATLTDALTSPTTFAGVITGSGGLTLNGSGGSLSLSGVNTYSGPTTVSAGTLNLIGTIGSGTGTAITVFDTLTEGSFGVIAAGGSSLTIAGGTSTLSGINAYSGATIISGGTLQPGAANVFSANSPVVFGNVTNSVLNLNGFNESIGSLGGGGTLGGTVSLGTNTLTVGTLAAPSTFAGSITGTGSLAMTGPGSLTIASPQSFGSTSTNPGTTSVIMTGGTLNLADPSALGVAEGTVSIIAPSTTELSTDTGFGGANPLYNIYLGNSGFVIPAFAGTIELNRLTPGAVTGITHNFDTLTMSLFGGLAGTLNVTAGPNAPTGGALDTISFATLTFGNNNQVTETLNPTGGNIVIGNAAIVALPTNNFTDTLNLGGTTPGNQITGTISNTVNGGSTAQAALLKSNTSVWTLSGASTYTGPTTVAGGTLILTGSIDAANTPDGAVTVGNTAGVNAVLNINGGTLNSNNGTPVQLGDVANAAGAINLNSSGTLATTSQFWVGQTGYGSMTVNSGALTIASWLSVGRNAGYGVVNVTGGTLTHSQTDNSHITIGSGGGAAGGMGVVNLSGGNITSNNSVWVGEVSSAVLNVSGTGTLTAPGVTLIPNTAGVTASVNLLGGGTITTGSVNQGLTGGNGTSFNFNGGTLLASGDSATFMGGLTNAYVYGGNGTVDNGGHNITIGQALLAPTGNGTSASGLAITGGSGYIGAPVVTLAGGGGVGATASAVVTGGTVIGITITNPGIGYTSVPTFTLNGGGGTGASVGAGTAAVVPNSGGGLTFQGVGTTTLTGANTYSGVTNVSSGSVFANNATSSLGTGAVNVNGGLLAGNGTISNGSNALSVNSGGKIGAGATATTTGTLNTGSQAWNNGGGLTIKTNDTGNSLNGSVTGQAGAAGSTTGWDLVTMSSLTSNLNGNTTFSVSLTGNPVADFSGTASYLWPIAQITSGAPITTGTMLATTDSTGANVPAAGELFTLDTTNFVNNNATATAGFYLEAVNSGGGETLDIGYNTAPEPGTAMLVLGGAVPMLMARRRRRGSRLQ